MFPYLSINLCQFTRVMCNCVLHCCCCYNLDSDATDCFLLAFIAMASYTAYVFLPGDIVMLTHFLQYLAGTRSEAEL